MFDPALGLAVVFNGCIYNFHDLRGALEQKGYRFFSECDTEVILKAFHAWGARCVERFLGMFAFAMVDELGYLSFSRAGAELLFQVLADRYERASLLITSNLAFGDWGQIFQGDRMTAALLDRLTHRCHIFEMNGESYRFRESVKAGKKNKAGVDAKVASSEKVN